MAHAKCDSAGLWQLEKKTAKTIPRNGHLAHWPSEHELFADPFREYATHEI
jgi:hypothetical protein